MPKCHFQEGWCQKFPWLQRVPGQSDKAYCKLCFITFSLSNMGHTAVKSHKNGKKHIQRESSLSSSSNLGSFLASAKSNAVTPNSVPDTQDPAQDIILVSTTASVEPVAKSQPNNSTLDKFVLKDYVTRSEIMWCIQTILTHKSLRSAEKDMKLFSNLFPGSSIAKNMQLSRVKMAYVIVHGLSPLFEKILLDDITVLDHLVIGFDECLNKITQKQQMDLNVRFWDPKQNLVKTCYLNSVFLGRSCATDLLEAFLSIVKPFSLRSILQISMDGPNTNFKFFKELQRHILELSPDDPEMLTIGSCGLHALNVAFKTGAKASGWCISEFLKSLYYLFKDSPARRARYTTATNSNLFPKKFCSVRWLENSPAASRAQEMMPYLKTFVKHLEKEKDAPTSKSYCFVKESLKDELLAAKICFFQIISSEVESFLKEYQSDIPLIPFLFADFTALSKSLMERFILKSELKTTGDVLNVDVNNQKNFIATKSVDVGISTVSIIKKAKVSETEINKFKGECRKFLISCIMKVQERSPLKYSLTKAASCFDPSVAVNDGLFSKRLEKLLLILIEKRWITPLEAETAKKQLKDVCSRQSVIQLLKNYKRYGPEKERVDTLWFNILSVEGGRKESLKILKIVMILSHGNANIERGFSINSDCLWENMKEESVIARRRVFDYVTMRGGLSEMQITKQMIQAARSARARYGEAQEAKSKEEKNQHTLLKRKREATNLIKELELKKAKLLMQTEKERLQIEEEISSLRVAK